MESTDCKIIRSLILPILAATSATLLLLFLLTSPSIVAVTRAQAGSVPCLDDYNKLEGLVDCLHYYMPHRHSVDDRDGFDVPTATEIAQWREVVAQMMEGKCDTIDLSGYDWGADFTVTTFTDTQVSKPFCVLVETRYDTYPAGTRVTHGWGTFVYNPTNIQELNISAPHAKYEIGTGVEAVSVFKHTRSRTFLMTGAHRYASDAESDCQSGHKRSDPAHNTQHMFHATVEELRKYYSGRNCQFYHLQFHGMASCCDSCDVHLSHGSNIPPTPGDEILELRDNLPPDWRVCLAGDATCTLNGTKNVQGRLLNGVPNDQVCVIPATSYSGHFIHIEQCLNYREADAWIQAINRTSWEIPCLVVTKHAAPAPVADSELLTYTLRITNTGGMTLTATITDILPAHVTPTNILPWEDQVITAPGGVWAQAITVTVEEGYTGSLTNEVKVTTDEGASGMASVTVCANVCKIYLPIILKNWF